MGWIWDEYTSICAAQCPNVLCPKWDLPEFHCPETTCPNITVTVCQQIMNLSLKCGDIKLPEKYCPDYPECPKFEYPKLPCADRNCSADKFTCPDIRDDSLYLAILFAFLLVFLISALIYYKFMMRRPANMVNFKARRVSKHSENKRFTEETAESSMIVDRVAKNRPFEHPLLILE